MYVVGAVKLSALPDKKLDSVLLPEPLGPTIVSLSPGASLILSGQPRAGTGSKQITDWFQHTL